MEVREIEKLFENIPRFRVGFYPTPFHQLNNLSKKYGVNLFMKREDLSGPSTFGGNKIRKLEFIIGDALNKGIDYIVSTGGYQSNSAMELAQVCRIAGIEPILYLYDTISQGLPEEYRGNLLLDKIMGVEINYIPKEEGLSTSSEEFYHRIVDACETRTEQMKKEGYKVEHVPSGCAYGNGFLSHVFTFTEMLKQAEAYGKKLDYVFHTTGTGGTLPGLIAGKLLTGADTKIMSMAINPYRPGLVCSKEVVVERVQYIFNTLKVECPDYDTIYREIHIDEDFIGADYGVPSDVGTAAIKEVAREEAVFIDSVYTGKGFAGMLDYIKTGKVPKGSNIAFVHTGGTGALFAERRLVGEVTED